MSVDGDPSKPSVLVLHDRPEDFRDLLRERFADLSFTYAATPDEVPAALDEARPEVVFSIKQSGFPGSAHRPVVDFPGVKWLQVGGSGYEHLVPWDARRLTVTNCAGVLSPYLAETVTGAMLMLNGGLPRYLRQQAAGLWAPRPFRPIRGQTLLVVGLGQIGGHVAANAKALGMRVLGMRRRRDPHPAADEMLPPDALLDALGRADVVSLHLRLNEETRGLFGRPAFAAMKPGALFINTARGPIVEEAALVEALESGHLGGAYLDVFETEPLPPDSPLWRVENVVLTPHASDNVVGWPRLFADFFADNLERWRAGKPLRNLVGG